MYVQESLAAERQRERLEKAQEERLARQITEIRRVQMRRQRVERELAQTRRRLEQLRAMIAGAS